MEDTEHLKKELDEQTRRAEERLDQLKYLRADFENLRKRHEKEKEALTAMANERLIRDLLIILDDFEQALPSLKQEENREGIQMVYRKLLKILSGYGLEPIECIGKKFDPNTHEAVCTERCSEETGTILEDLKKGYRLKSRVIRPPKVKIAEKVTGKIGENHE